MRILFNAIAKFISQGLSSFADNFASRSNTTGGLGTSTSGDEWTPINGTINVQSGAAKAGSTPTYSSNGSAYPMSAVTMSKSDVNIKLAGTNQGSTLAIWVQDSDEWWGVVSRAVQNSTPGNTTYGYQYAVAGNTPAWNASNTTNYALASTSHSNYVYNSSSHSNYVYNSSSHSNFKYNSSSHSNFTTTYTRVAFFVYGFTSSTTYSANFGSKYNSKYAIAYNRYTWGVTNYGYVVNSTFYAYNSTTNSSTTTNYGTGVASTTTNYGTSVGATTTNYGTGVGNTTTNYFYNASSTTNYLEYSVPNYGFAYGVTGTNATTYTVNQYLDIIQSTATAVSTISSSLVSAAATIGSILVSLSNNQITAKAYSDTNFVTQIGSDLVYTATGAVVTTQFGIAISPSTYNQSDIIGTSVEIDVV